MKTNALTALCIAILLPRMGLAQAHLPPSSATAPQITLPDPLPASPTPAPTPKGVPAPAPNAAPNAAVPEKAAPPLPAQNPPPSAPAQTLQALQTPGKDQIQLNFQNAALTDVLNYLSEAAGFVILQEAPLSGTVNVVSRQPISLDEAIDLLNAVLSEKGYTAIRNGRILKIVSRSEAGRKDLPVKTGSDPEQIPRKDGMVTQILPVRYVEVAKLVENLRPLLGSEANISANESSNAILLVDTQTNVHRMAEIIHALDTSVSSISSIRVYQLQFADAKSLAGIITQLFASDASATGGTANGAGGGGGGGWGGRGMRGFPGMGLFQPPNTEPKSLAQKAATRVVAVADETSNSVVVTAPEEMLAGITEIVSRIDTDIADITDTQIFRLQHADAMELADVINTLYSDSQNGTSRSGGRTGQLGVQQGFAAPWQAAQTSSSSQNKSQRALLQARVVAVADPRTNSVVISAAKETMSQIALTVGRLDSGDSKKQRVYVHRLENADPDNVATILRGMYSSQGASAGTSTQPSASRLNQRTTTGASSDGSDILGSSNTRSNLGR